MSAESATSKVIAAIGQTYNEDVIKVVDSGVGLQNAEQYICITKHPFGDIHNLCLIDLRSSSTSILCLATHPLPALSSREH